MEFTLKHLMRSFLLFVMIAGFVSPASAAIKFYAQDAQPATCNKGDMWTDTNGTSSERIYSCESTNTWVKQVGNGPTSNPSLASLNVSGGNLAANNMQVTKAWMTGLSYTTNETSVIHGGQHYVCTSSHTAGASTEPGVGASWATVWAVASGGASTLNDLTDVDTTGAANGSVIKYNGSSWVIGSDNSGAGATVSDTAYDATSWNAITDVAPSKNAVRDWIESLPSLVISTGLTDNSGTVSVTNPVTAEAFSGSGWNADTEGLTRNDAYDYTHIADTDDDGLPNKVDLATAGMVKVDSSGVLSIGASGVDYEASTPATKIVATTAGISEADLLAAKYVSNYGASGTVIMTLPAPSYNVSRAFISEAAQIIQVKPPSGEALSTPIGTQTADEVVSCPASVGNVLVATRYKTGASTWAWRVDPVNGVWSESGGLVINSPTFGGVTIADSGIITFDEAAANPDDADIQLSATDGVFKIASVNGVNNEDLTVDLDQTANTAIIGSSTGLTMVTTGSIPFTGAVNIIGKSSDYTIGQDNPNEAYGSMFLNTAASTRTFTLPAAAPGMAVCVRNAQGISQILRLDAASGDYIVKSTGARTSASGEYYGATADAKNQVCVVAYDSTDWYVTSETGTWTEE
jgi:hypothetical protein